MEPPFEQNGSLFADSPGSIHELPLFPLDLVLFPGMKAKLHIFEDRYKALVRRCLDESRPFGIVLISPDQPANRDVRKTKTYRVGCAARIVHVERLVEGRMNIEIEGVERFRIIEQHEVEPFRTGIVEPVADDPMSGAKSEVAGELSEQVQRLLREFLTRQFAMIGQRIVEFELPPDQTILSYITAWVLPIENGDKQSLLETTDTAGRLDTERDVLRRAVRRLRRAAATAENVVDASGEVTTADENDDATVSFEPVQTERYRDYGCGN